MDGYSGFSQIWLLLLVSSTLGDKIIARRLDATLPLPMVGMAVYYDGESDFIYLVSGADGFNYLESILRLDISADEIERIGSLPIGQGSWGTPHATDSLGDLVYFSTTFTPWQIHKFDIVKNSVKTIGEFSYRSPNSAAGIKNSAGNVLVIGGGFENDVYEYNIETDAVQGEIVGQVPENFFLTAAAVKVRNNTALVLGSGGTVPYFEFDFETLETKYVAVNSFPEFQYGMTVTSDRHFVYVYGGNLAPDGMAIDGIIKLDPITYSWDYIEVEYDPPVPEHSFRRQTEIIWVEKLNRIYMFGGVLGMGSKSIYLDDIYYIDLDQISPPTDNPTQTTTEKSTSTKI